MSQEKSKDPNPKTVLKLEMWIFNDPEDISKWVHVDSEGKRVYETILLNAFLFRFPGELRAHVEPVLLVRPTVSFI
jgi:hypothetical protein